MAREAALRVRDGRAAAAGDEAGALEALRCLETAGRLISNGSASSATEASPGARRARMAPCSGSPCHLAVRQFKTVSRSR
jgi:hypothetical protein